MSLLYTSFYAHKFLIVTIGEVAALVDVTFILIARTPKNQVLLTRDG